MTDTPSPDKLQKLPKWAQDYVAWLREQLTARETEVRRKDRTAHGVSGSKTVVRNYPSISMDFGLPEMDFGLPENARICFKFDDRDFIEVRRHEYGLNVYMNADGTLILKPLTRNTCDLSILKKE
jgi:hypothetical protein